LEGNPLPEPELKRNWKIKNILYGIACKNAGERFLRHFAICVAKKSAKTGEGKIRVF
jgi:hypothetical protein